jgi:hypothetical protein
LWPENTLPGLAHMPALGVDAIEFDVTLTADGGPADTARWWRVFGGQQAGHEQRCWPGK